MWMALLTVMPIHGISVYQETWSSVSLDVLVLHLVLSTSQGNTSTKGTMVFPLNWKMRLLPDHFGLLTLLEQIGGRVPVFVGVTDLEYQGETGLL